MKRITYQQQLNHPIQAIKMTEVTTGNIFAKKGVSFRELVMDCVRKKHEKVPNEETLEAFRQSEAGDGLVEYTSVSDMLKKLGVKC